MAGHTRTILAVRNISGAHAGATLIGEVIGDAFFGENSESSLFCSVLEFAEHEHYLLPRGRDLRELYTLQEHHATGLWRHISQIWICYDLCCRDAPFMRTHIISSEPPESTHINLRARRARPSRPRVMLHYTIPFLEPPLRKSLESGTLGKRTT